MLMAGSKAGRRKKPGPRYPGGKLVGDEPPAALYWQRARAAAIKQLGDTRFADEVGRLALANKLTHQEMAAVSEIRSIVADWHRVEGLRAAPASPSFEAGRGRSLSADNGKAYSRARRRWERLQNCYPNAVARSVIERLCDGEAIAPPTTLEQVKWLLRRVCIEFNLNESPGSTRGVH